MHIVLLKRLAISPSECASECRSPDGVARGELEFGKKALELARHATGAGTVATGLNAPFKDCSPQIPRMIEDLEQRVEITRRSLIGDSSKAGRCEWSAGRAGRGGGWQRRRTHWPEEEMRHSTRTTPPRCCFPRQSSWRLTIRPPASARLAPWRGRRTFLPAPESQVLVEPTRRFPDRNEEDGGRTRQNNRVGT